MVYITNSERETEALGERFGSAVPDGTVAALYGDLGCGKTAFVRGMARGMGLDVPVTSPTFTIVNEYIGSRQLFHFDMYRLSDAEELYDIGWEDYLGRSGVCAVEWSENVPGAFEGDEYVIRFSKLSDTRREISIEGGPQKC
ncbi:MAG: tRNA (adenosine(37)-N6)-threonylcarbamoyltransferase complex ATPase subunit type 1 TsaE [Oscillospiraceae bacterium]|nr:tRNA (adenosine(37)-N6)-threonylcarbamoyltransferase complex ATPase subunit type 1 TsaE [Oscillospiraceae bacterium]